MFWSILIEKMGTDGKRHNVYERVRIFSKFLFGMSRSKVTGIVSLRIQENPWNTFARLMGSLPFYDGNLMKNLVPFQTWNPSTEFASHQNSWNWVFAIFWIELGLPPTKHMCPSTTHPPCPTVFIRCPFPFGFNCPCPKPVRQGGTRMCRIRQWVSMTAFAW